MMERSYFSNRYFRAPDDLLVQIASDVSGIALTEAA
jgi:hypothetical protein